MDQLLDGTVGPVLRSQNVIKLLWREGVFRSGCFQFWDSPSQENLATSAAQGILYYFSLSIP